MILQALFSLFIVGLFCGDFSVAYDQVLLHLSSHLLLSSHM